jgi:hypothetical protein
LETGLVPLVPLGLVRRHLEIESLEGLGNINIVTGVTDLGDGSMKQAQTKDKR